MVNRLETEFTIDWTAAELAAQVKKVERIPLKRAVRSIYLDMTSTCTVSTAATMILSLMEFIDEIEIEHGKHELTYRGKELEMIMIAFFDERPLLDAISYTDASTAAHSLVANVRLPVFAQQNINENLTIRIKPAAETTYSETVANTSATLSVSVTVDYVDSVEYELDNWYDNEDALATKKQFDPSRNGTYCIGVGIVAMDDRDDVNTTAGRAANYEDEVTEIEIADVDEFMDIESPRDVRLRGPGVSENENGLAGLYWIPIPNIKVSNAFNIQINGNTTDIFLNVFYKTPVPPREPRVLVSEGGKPVPATEQNIQIETPGGTGADVKAEVTEEDEGLADKVGFQARKKGLTGAVRLF